MWNTAGRLFLLAAGGTAIASLSMVGLGAHKWVVFALLYGTVWLLFGALLAPMTGSLMGPSTPTSSKPIRPVDV